MTAASIQQKVIFWIELINLIKRKNPHITIAINGKKHDKPFA